MADSKFHKNTGPKTLEQLAEISGADLIGDGTIEVQDVAALSDATDKDISFLDNVKYKDAFKETKASAVIISEKMKEFAPEDTNLLISKNPYKGYALIAQAFYPIRPDKGDISAQAFIHETAKVDPSCIIEAGAFIGENVDIGANTRVGANASITHSIIGQGCNIYPGVRIGQDGFGFAIDPTGHVKVPQLGRVIIGDNVEIGANTCIDRGAGPDTIIGDSTWIDNLVQIGHNVKIGRGCVIVAHAGIAGSTILEDYVVVAAQVGIAGHLTIGMGAKIAGQSGVMQNVAPQSNLMGTPAVPIKQNLRMHAYLKKLVSKS